MAHAGIPRIRETALRNENGDWDWNAILNREIYPAIRRLIDAFNAIEDAYTTVQDEGVDLANRRTLNFTGASVTASDDPANARTNVEIVAGIGALRNFDNSNDPIFLYNFDVGLTNMGSAGAAGDMVAESGTVPFTHIFPGKQGVFVDGVNTLVATGFSSVLAHTGDITVMLMEQLDSNSGATGMLISHGASGETEAANVLYSIRLSSVASIVRPFEYFSEHGAGVDDAVQTPTSFVMPPIHNMLWLGIVRSGTSVSVWLNGFKVATGTITAPTGGDSATARLRIGGFPGFTTTRAIIFGAKGVARAYTDDEMRAEYNSTMGGAFGEI